MSFFFHIHYMNQAIMYETRKLLLHSKKRKRNQIENNITEDCDITNFAIPGIINVHCFFFLVK